MHAGLRLPLRPGIRILIAVAVAGTALGLGIPAGTTPGDAADRYIAGGPVVERSPVAAERASAARALARAFGSRLGLAEPAAFRVERVVDRFASTTYDEVTGTDETGRALHLQRLDDRGRLIAAVVFGWQSSGGRPLADARAAGDRGSRLVGQLGLEAPGAPETRRLPDDDGWTVSWPRVVEGVPVIGDGVRIDLWPDGRVHAVVRTERDLAPAPSSILDQAAARSRAEAVLADLFASRAGEIAVARLALGWIAPNDAFDPSGPDAAGSTLRLAWVVEARTAGDLAEGLRAVKLFLDAGSGALLGGDVLR